MSLVTGIGLVKNKKKLGDFFKNTGIFWIFIILCIILAFLSPAFISPVNIMNVVKQISIMGILGIGMTLVIISGGIDLSVASIIALSGVCAAFFAREESSIPLIVPIIAALAVGLLIGLINGVFIAYVNFPPFIMTLAIMISSRGLALVLCDGRPIFGLSQSFNNIANGFIFGVPNLIYYVLMLIAFSHFVLRRTVFGKRVYAIGGNETATRLSGINVKLLKVIIYMLSGFLAGFCGLLMASRINSGNAVVANGYELNAIAAAVIGGVSMSGGVGSVLGTLIGALIIGVIQNGLDILSVSPFYQQIIQGLIIILAVFLDIKSKSKI